MARRKTAQERRIEKLLANLEPKVRQAFMESVYAMRGSIDEAALIKALTDGDIYRALDMLRVNQAILFPITDAVRASYIAGGFAAAEALPVRIRAQFGWGNNPRAESAVQRITGELIQHITGDTLEIARDVFTTGVRDGVPPAKQAREIVGRWNPITKRREGGFMGLDDARAAQAKKVEAMLRDPEQIRDYFVKDSKTGRWKPRYKTTDRRFDKRVLKAIKDGKALGKRDIAEITSRHRARLLVDRGKTIARTETLNALRSGQHDGYATLVDTGVVKADEMEKTWLVTRDGRERPAHAALGGTTIGFNDLFQSPAGGQLAHAGDTAHGAGAADIIACRCATIYRYKPRGIPNV